MILFNKMPVILLLVVALFAGCLNPKKKDQNESEDLSTFYVDSFNGELVKQDINKKWQIIEAKEYQITVCLNDQISKRKLLGQKFKVVGKGIDKKAETNNYDGCISWSERVDYEYYAASSHYIQFDRWIIGAGIFNGKRLVSYAINPWKKERGDYGEEVVFLNKKSLSQSLLQISDAKSDPNNGELVIIEPNVIIEKEQYVENGAELKFRVSFGLQVLLKGLSGDVDHKIDIKHGEFSVDFYLIAEKKTKKGLIQEPLFKRLSNKFHTVKNEKVTFEFVDILKFKPRDGKIKLALKITPNIKMKGLRSKKIIFNFTTYNKILGSHKAKRAIDEEQLQYEKLTKSFNGNKKNFNKRGLLIPLKPYSFSIMDIRFDQVKPGETATKRTVVYRVKSCVTRTLERTKILYSDFKLIKPDGSVATLNTSDHGCLMWNDEVTHKYYQPEKLIKKEFSLINNDSELNTKLVGYLNPWDFGWTFGRDERTLEDSYIEEVNNRIPIDSKLFLQYYAYQTIRFRYEVDQFMNLKVKKTVLLNLTPKVFRYNSITLGRGALEYLRDGIYLLKVAIQKDYYDAKYSLVKLMPDPEDPKKTYVERDPDDRGLEYIAAVKKLVRVQHGQIITPLELSMEDLRLMRIRSNFLVQLQTVDEEKLKLNNNLSIRDITPAKVERLLADIRNKKEKELNKKHRSTVGKVEKYDKNLNEKLEGNDLDLLIEEDSGLASRTFVGPLVFLSNKFYTNVRPTDDLEEIECRTMDCNALSKEEKVPLFEQDINISKYHGSVKHLANSSVDDLISRMNVLENNKLNKKKYLSLLSNYLDAFKMNFVSLSGEVLKKIEGFNPDTGRATCLSDDIDECLVETDHRSINYNLFTSYLTDLRNKQILSKSQLRKFVKTAKLPKNGELALCRFWINYMMGDRVGFRLPKDRIRNHARHNFIKFHRSRLLTYCRNTARKDINNVFTIARHLRTEEIGDYLFLGGKSLNLNVGSDFSLSYGESMSFGATVKVDPLGWIKAIPSKVASIVGGIFGFDFSWKAGESASYKQGTAVSSGTYLVMQRATFDIQFKKFRRCIELRIRPSFFEKYRSFERYFSKMKKQQKFLALTEGVFICDGKVESSDEYFRERYYYFTQHFTEGDMLDKGNLVNAPWLLALRGEREYSNFVTLLKANPVENTEAPRLPHQYIDTFLQNPGLVHSAKRKVVNIAELPLSQINEAYLRVLPTFPGVYIIRPKYEEYPY